MPASSEISQLVPPLDTARIKNITNQQDSHTTAADAIDLLRDAVNRALLALMRVRASDRLSNPGLAPVNNLREGDCWVEASGISPARTATLMLRDGGVTRTIFTSAPY